jgi:hypothetical protein
LRGIHRPVAFAEAQKIILVSALVAPMKHRKLRIAWSVAWGIAAVLMLALWLRSFWCWDDCWLKLSNSYFAHGISAEGRIVIWVEHSSLNRRFEFNVDPLSIHRSPPGHERHPWIGLYISPSGNTHFFQLAHGFLVMIAAALAAIPWCPTRFSMRGMLLATTCIALIIGLIVWADHFY